MQLNMYLANRSTQKLVLMMALKCLKVSKNTVNSANS